MISKEKQVVHFSEVHPTVCVGIPTYVKPLDHPSELVPNLEWARTSMVVHVAKDNDGNVIEFETLNTIYVKE